jgi:hypothetical protein
MMAAMKHPICTLLSPALIFSLAALTLHAQAPAGGDPFVKGAPAAPAAASTKGPNLENCLLVMEVYSLDKIDAVGILDSERGSAARYRRITDLAAGGKARLEILTALTTKAGQRAVNQSIDEVRFASLFLPPQTTWDAPTPTEWAPRNLGDTIEFEPDAFPDGRTSYVNLALSRVCLAGFRDIGSIAGIAAVSQPQFTSQKLVLTVGVTDGEPHFLGSFSPPTLPGIANGGGASQVWLAFIHLSLQKPAPPAQPPSKPSKPEMPKFSEVHLEYTCYSLDRILARDILLAPALSPAPWEKIQTLVGDKRARLEHVMSLNASSGQRSDNEETQEFFYASGYSIPQWTGTVQENRRTTTTGPTAEKQDDPPKKEGGKAATVTETVETNHTAPNPDRIPGSADTFESRNLGVSLQVEPWISADGLTVDLNEVFQSSAYLGDLKGTGAGAGFVPQPIFQTRKFTTCQAIPTGRPILVGTLNPPLADGVSERTDAGRTWLVFVRATTNEP